MSDYFEILEKDLKQCRTIEIVRFEKTINHQVHTFDLFENKISDSVRIIYDNYAKYVLFWEERTHNLRGVIDLIPYDNIVSEHKELCEMIQMLDDNLIEEQEKVVEDIMHWYPIFRFPNGDFFCYDNRNRKIVFFEHDVFDSGINLHGLVIAETIDALFENWSRVFFVDLYDWTDGVNENGIDLNREVFQKGLRHLNGF